VTDPSGDRAATVAETRAGLPDPGDLAPGDAWAADFDWHRVALHRVRSADDPRFARAYELLWREFGAQHEVEQRSVLEARLAWRPAAPVDGCALRYELLVVERAGEIVAVRDHTAILPLASDGPVVVHLSHALVLPAERKSGLGAWLRALPVATARACARESGAGARDVVLVAEMEPHDPAIEARTARLRIYGRAGFRAIDPARVDYHQPDFRTPAEIDATGVAPLPLTLVVRRVGREHEPAIAARELRAIVRALYTMYGAHQRASDMAPLWKRFERLPEEGEEVRLLAPLP
jgi:hypothetical protein